MRCLPLALTCHPLLGSGVTSQHAWWLVTYQWAIITPVGDQNYYFDDTVIH